MEIPELFFYLFAFLVVGMSIVVVFSTNLLHAAFTLFFVLFGMAGFYALLGGDFIAMVQLMVYAGGINILLIFGTMLTADIIKPEESNFSFQGILTFVSGVAFAAVLFSVLNGVEWPVSQPLIAEPTTLDLGRLLLKEYILPFEVISFLLVAAMVGAIMVVMKGGGEK